MAYGNALRFTGNTLLSLGYASFPVDAGTWGLIGLIPNIARLIRIQNLTDVSIFFSLDGVNQHEILVTQSFLLLDISSNQSEMGGLYLPANQPIYASYAEDAAPGSGAVYVSSFYGYNGEQ